MARSEVPEGAADDALKALAKWRKENPAHAKWIEDGAKPIHSQEEHVAVFGVRYGEQQKKGKKRR